jgi:hypothetical protein
MKDLIIQGCRLKMTCQACPEQYDVFFENHQIGYLRLRHGNFSASYPDYGGDIVFGASPKGDGVFKDSERFKYLNAAVSALIEHHNNKALDYYYSSC